MILLAARCALALGGDPSVVPIPVGPGPRYRPAAVVRDGRPLGTLTCGPAGRTFRVHLELFAHRKVVIVPPGIGVARSGCVYPARTTHADRDRRGRAGREAPARRRLPHLGPRGSGRARCSRSARSTPVRAYVAGKRYDGPGGARSR